MALHVRYTNGRHNDKRLQVKFIRRDLLWKTNEQLTSPYFDLTLNGLPIMVGETGRAVGPTILDMMVRTVYPKAQLPEPLRSKVPANVLGAALWTRRNLPTLWRDPDEIKQPAREVEDIEREREPDHPFKVALASGGKVLADRGVFVEVEKATTVTLNEVAFRLAVGMRGSVPDAYAWVSQIAAAQWADDLERAQALWRRMRRREGC